MAFGIYIIMMYAPSDHKPNNPSNPKDYQRSQQFYRYVPKRRRPTLLMGQPKDNWELVIKISESIHVSKKNMHLCIFVPSVRIWQNSGYTRGSCQCISAYFFIWQWIWTISLASTIPSWSPLPIITWCWFVWTNTT